MSKTRDLANFVATGGEYSDAALQTTDLENVTATATQLNYNTVTALGTVEASKVVTADANADVTWGDNDKALFGTGSDLKIYHDGSHSYIEENSTGDLIIKASNMRLQSSTGEYYLSNNADGSVGLYYDNSPKIVTAPSGITVYGTASATDFDTTSDVAFKTDIVTIGNPLEKVMSLRGVNFSWKENNKPAMGVVAQEVEEVIPEIVNTREDGSKGVSYQSMVGLLIEAIKDLKKEIDDLKGSN